MELTQDQSRTNNDESLESDSLHLPGATPFNAEHEHQELQDIMASAPPTNCVHSCFNSQEVVATAVPISSDAFQENAIPMVTATAVTAAQIGEATSFVPSQELKGAKEEEVIVSPQLSNNANLATAPTLQSYTSPTTHQYATASLLREAQHRGEVETEIDKTKDMFAKAQLENMRSETAAALEIAKVKAQKAKRIDEGLTVDEGIHHYVSSEINARREEQQHVRPFGTTKNGKRGYEVNEYDVAEYDTAEYDVSEYKSVYD